MSEHETSTAKATTDDGTPGEGKLHGWMAEYDSVDTLLAACRKVRDAGYKKTDAFTPFPVHGIDQALGIKPTVLPWIALVAGLTGTATAIAMQWWMNGIDYKYIISGKPYVSFPAYMPVAFELTILFASFGTFFGMWALNKLPRFSSPVFTDPRFDRATDDRFFLYVDAKDDQYDASKLETMLSDSAPASSFAVYEDDSPKQVPRAVFMVWMLVIGLSAFPLLLVLRMRLTRSDQPRWHVFYDMDFSPSKDAQQATSLFADARTMRPDVPGTVARGQMGPNMTTGVDVERLSQRDPNRNQRFVALLSEVDDEVTEVTETEPDGDVSAAEAPEAKPESKVADAEKSDAEKPDVSEPAETAEPMKTPDKNVVPDPDDPLPTEVAENMRGNGPDVQGDNLTGQPEAGGKTEQVQDSSLQKPAEAMGIAAGEDTVADENPQTGETSAQSVMDTTPWVKDIPLPVDRTLMAKGQEQFNIYCAVCHGRNGGGNGMVNRRAQKILAQNWVPPSSLHDPALYDDQYADGKLFSTITNGIRKMPGYASQIKVEDRWAIVAYVRALQASRQASIDDVPEAERRRVERERQEVENRLAEEERKAKEREAKAAQSES